MFCGGVRCFWHVAGCLLELFIDGGVNEANEAHGGDKSDRNRYKGWHGVDRVWFVAHQGWLVAGR